MVLVEVVDEECEEEDSDYFHKLEDAGKVGLAVSDWICHVKVELFQVERSFVSVVNKSGIVCSLFLGQITQGNVNSDFGLVVGTVRLRIILYSLVIGWKFHGTEL